MKDKTGLKMKKNVLHLGYEGQSWFENEEKCPSSGYEGQNWFENGEKCPSSGL